MDLSLAGKHALVCGASQGIGRATAIALARLGASVTALARTEATLASLVAELPRLSPAQTHGAIAADVADLAHLRAQVEAVTHAAPVHVLVNNTGGPPGGPAHTATGEQFLAAFNQHLLANHALVKAVLAGMQRAGYGRVINVISTSVKEPIPNLGVSNTIRGAVASWAKTLSRELGPHAITVNNVLPGYTQTGRLEQIIDDRARATGKAREEIAAGMLATVPLARFAEPSEVASAIAFLASPAASYISGVSLAVDGGRMQSI